MNKVSPKFVVCMICGLRWDTRRHKTCPSCKSNFGVHPLVPHNDVRFFGPRSYFLQG